MTDRAWNEKRECLRHLCHCPVSYMVTGTLGSRAEEITIQGEIVDLGHRGIGMRTKRRTLEEETVVLAWIPVSEPPITLPVLAQVIWVKKEQAGTYAAGLRFVW